MVKKINPLVINITSAKLEFCGVGSINPLTFPFPPTSVSEMEIINKEELKSKLQAFFSEHQIHALPTVLILNESMYYSKDFLTSAPPPFEDIQKYLDLVPFSTVSYKIYRLPVGHRLVVINRDFYESLKNILLSLGFSIISVVPGFVVTGPGTTTAFSAQTCLLINRKMDVILDSSFGGSENPTNAATSTHRYIEGHKTLVSVLAILVILACPVIIYFYFQKQKTEIATKKLKITKPAAVVAKPTIIPTPTATLAQRLNLNQYTLQLLNGSGVIGLAASLEAELKSIGFPQTITGNFSKTANTTIVYKPSVPKEVRDLIQETLSPLFKNISAKDNATSQFDIVITTGKIN